MELITTDAAANEILATNIGAGKRSAELEPANGDGDNSTLTPNLKMIGRDKAHSFRRLMTRPFQCDPFLDEIMDDFVLSKSSICQLVQNSHELKSMFQEEIEQQVGCKRISNLRAAKHRFESLAAPMGRALLYLPSFVACCQRVAETRADTSMGKQTKVFLEGLTCEKLIQLAVLADALDESMVLLRSVDEENVDVSGIPIAVQAYVDRLHSLLGPNRSALTCHGYTQHVCRLLDDGKVVYFIKGTAMRRLRLHDAPAVFGRVFNRMGCWLTLSWRSCAQSGLTIPSLPAWVFLVWRPVLHATQHQWV